MRIKIKECVVLGFRPASPGGLAIRVSARSRRQAAGFTLVEVVIAAAIVGLIFGGVINSYIQAGKRIEWTGYSLAAQSLASEVIEQAKSAVWDPAQQPAQNQVLTMSLQNSSYNATTQILTGYNTGILDIPYSRTNAIIATNYISVQMTYVGGNTNVPTQCIRVDTVWPFSAEGRNVYFTNTICTIMAPDNRSNGTF